MNAYNFGQIEVRKGEYRISGMSHALRHAPSDYGLTLNDDGTVLVEDLANAFNVSVDDILNVVETDAKGRYGLVDGEDNALRIRALHGHSVPVDFEMTIVENPGTIFHGTKVDFLPSILESGLNRGSRNHVHLSSSVSTALQVANRRKGETVLLLIDASALMNSGQTVYLTATGIYLANAVPVEFITEIVYV